MSNLYNYIRDIDNNLSVTFVYYDNLMLEIRDNTNNNNYVLRMLLNKLQLHIDNIYIANIELLYEYGPDYIWNQNDTLQYDNTPINEILIDCNSEFFRDKSKIEICEYVLEILQNDNCLTKCATKI